MSSHLLWVMAANQHAAGISRKEIARYFEVSVTTAIKYITNGQRLRRRTSQSLAYADRVLTTIEKALLHPDFFESETYKLQTQIDEALAAKEVAALQGAKAMYFVLRRRLQAAGLSIDDVLSIWREWKEETTKK